ncbi:MAG: hypothetical protein DKT66_24655 [Candidatus Melainabacteria bacterium]|nr:MAG: hypothetical protein DKT66_24655 [Candidatus Melainabacteria bacterium]
MEVYVAYQKPIFDTKDPTTVKGFPRTFEDALILENRAALSDLPDKAISERISKLVKSKLADDELGSELFTLLKSAEKAEFALECLLLDDEKALKPPTYIEQGLRWFQKVVDEHVFENDSKLLKEEANP